MRRLFVHAVPVPKNGLSAGFERVDYADAYATEIPAISSARSLAEAVFATAPRRIAALLALRNAIVQPFGLVATKSALGRAAFAVNPIGERIGFFPVFAATPEEVLLGLDDRHLDFRISVRVIHNGSAHLGVVATLVRFHGWLGRWYFFLVRPAHRLIVPVMLRSGVKRLEQNSRKHTASRQ